MSKTPRQEKLDLEFKIVVLDCLDDLLTAHTFRSRYTMKRLEKLAKDLHNDEIKMEAR